MASEGELAPPFDLASDTKGRVRLKDLKGQIVVLYFYPKDDTSGCTREGIDFSALAGDFEGAGANVIGVSPDSLASHTKFRCKHDLSITLLADEEKAAAGAYGVWVEKSMYGRKYMGVERSTFLIDAKGVIRKRWSKVKIPGHAEEVLAAVKALRK